jgi:hypothetical protein
MENRAQSQPFDFYIVLDFEAAWTEQGGPKSAEIIEFPSHVLIIGTDA